MPRLDIHILISTKVADLGSDAEANKDCLIFLTLSFRSLVKLDSQKLHVKLDTKTHLMGYYGRLFGKFLGMAGFTVVIISYCCSERSCSC